jgi:hypothetical protein
MLFKKTLYLIDRLKRYMNFVECHEEPIHIPGSIQSFGYLIGIDAESRPLLFLAGIFRIYLKSKVQMNYSGGNLPIFPKFSKYYRFRYLYFLRPVYQT